jgi:hypothetical protein
MAKAGDDRVVRTEFRRQFGRGPAQRYVVAAAGASDSFLQ